MLRQGKSWANWDQLVTLNGFLPGLDVVFLQFVSLIILNLLVTVTMCYFRTISDALLIRDEVLGMWSSKQKSKCAFLLSGGRCRLSSLSSYQWPLSSEVAAQLVKMHTITVLTHKPR